MVKNIFTSTRTVVSNSHEQKLPLRPHIEKSRHPHWSVSNSHEQKLPLRLYLEMVVQMMR